VSRRLVASTGLLAGSLVAAVVGGYVELSDTDGFQDREPAQWLAPLGVLLLIAGVVLALTERRARRAVGAILLSAAVVVEVMNLLSPDLRFVWGPGEGIELLLLVGGLVGFVMLTPRLRRPEGGLTAWARVAGYLLTLAVVPTVVLFATLSYYDDRYCSSDGDDCLAPLSAFFWWFVAVVVLVMAAVVTEVVLAVRRRR
jgi:hypothetical protein